MNEQRERFRGWLVGMESVTPALRERYEREVRHMLEKKLNARMRAANIFALMLSVFFVGLFGYRMVFADIPILAKAGMAIGVLFSIGWIVLIVRILRRGSMKVKTDANAMTGLTWGFLVILITIFMLQAGRMDDPARGMSVVLNGLVFLVFGVVFLLQNTISQTSLQTREELLKIEYSLLDLEEKLNGKPD